MSSLSDNKHHRLTLAGLIITLGIVYGDIGTSPLYVFKAIVNGLDVLKDEYIYGAISCIIWTLTIQTTVKYVLITLRADNKGEGGIFALFALIRRKFGKAYILAIIGGSALLADGIITPSITVTSAVEGLRIDFPQLPVIPIVISIITVLFLVQQFGTKLLGNSFGPIMFIWFSMLGVLGVSQIALHTEVLKSFNPYYAYVLLHDYPAGFLLLGAVFLATTGAEALYSDLGHCGVKNIRISWLFVKATLILNYLGQGAWVIMNKDGINESVNPFYGIMPDWFLGIGIAIATAAAIIASQALISGSFTMISEAISLNFWPKFKLRYPTDIKGQIYIPRINWFLWMSCLFVVWYFQESSRMEAAYGLSITITMIMTTLLLTFYLRHIKVPMSVIVGFGFVFLIVEGAFLIANLNKFSNGGWFSIALAGIFFLIMYCWYNGRKLKNKFLIFVPIKNYLNVIHALSEDKNIPKYATNLVYITKANTTEEIEAKIIYSIINKQPKRADVYWFLHLDITDEPNTFEYRVHHYNHGSIVKVEFRLGFKIDPRIHVYFRQVLDDMKNSGEVDLLSRYNSLRRSNITGDFQYIIIDRIASFDIDFTAQQKFILTMYEVIKKMANPESRALGLDTSNCITEKVPLTVDHQLEARIKRVKF
ncbi:MAG TPA: KUP/HAK/KT family potassium transporter [Bacteroidales bacterium]|nr:KUP/HAK/KT family potassium transporter [Bacteroidales bacterium]